MTNVKTNWVCVLTEVLTHSKAQEQLSNRGNPHRAFTPVGM